MVREPWLSVPRIGSIEIQSIPRTDTCNGLWMSLPMRVMGLVSPGEAVGAVRARTVQRAIGAVVVLVLAAAAQAGLEQARLTRRPSPAVAAVAFLVAAVLAVIVTWRPHAPYPGVRPLRIVVPGPRWWLACVPGVVFLLIAAVVATPLVPHRIVFWTWAIGVGWLIAIGVVHAVVTRGSRLPDPHRDWSRRRLALCGLVLMAVAVGMRTALGIDRLPAFVESDEAFTIWSAHKIFADDPYNWFNLFWVGVPLVSLVCTRAAELLFGYSLWGARMGGVVLGTISVLATFGFGRRAVGNLPAFVGALLLAVAHTHVHWSRNAHPYIQTPAATAVALWLLVRVWNGGSLLAWLGVAIALGIGTLTYQASQLLPFLVLTTALGWMWIADVPWKRALVATLAIEVIAVLVMSPVLRAMLRSPELVASRTGMLFLLSRDNLAKLGNDPIPGVLAHARDTLTMFNVGTDSLSNYAAQRSLVDAVTAAMIPVSAAMLLVRWRSVGGWVCAAWWAAYLTFAVFLAAQLPSYHRVPTVLLFSSLAVAWALVELLEVMRRGFGLPRSGVAVGCLAFVAAAGGANVHYYFHEFRLARPLQHTLGFTQIMCTYAATHTIIDATTLDGTQYVPLENPPGFIMCPERAQIPRRSAVDLWNVEQLTQAERVVLIVPEAVAAAHPGEPRGYRVTRRYVDNRIGYPVRVPLAVYEMERVPPQTGVP